MEQSRRERGHGNQAYKAFQDRFQEIASQYPDLEAIRTPKGACSYRELELESRRIAHLILQELGLEPRPVALLLKDKRQAISGLLGVVRAGHFYCALSHRDPVPRLMQIMQDLEPPLLITDGQSLAIAKQITPQGCKILSISGLEEMVDSSPAVRGSQECMLGVFYTSGSTGKPKGVMRTHSYVMHRLSVDIRDFGIGPNDRLLFMRRLDVTSSLWQLFGCLLTGATLVLYEAEEVGLSPLAKLIKQEQITIFAPPIEFLRNFLDSLEEEIHFDTIRTVILGGDVLFRRDVERLRLHLSIRACVIHHLSSSESGLLARTILHADSEIESDVVPVGFPVAEKDLLIIGDNGQPILDGKPGQIVVRSTLNFAGYWRLAEQSATKFQPDPSDPSRKVFMTGDLGRFIPDGQLMFLGRDDFRVKIRGFSVDCASVEGALMAVPQVKRAAVIPVDSGGGQRYLIGCVVPYQGKSINAADLKVSLSRCLPDYMVPQRIIFLDELPKTRNGKIDRAALKATASSTHETALHADPPFNALEWKLARLWEDLLDIRPIGVNTDFFNLGGHSLLAIRMLDRVELETGVRLPASTLLQAATIKGLAEAIIHNELPRLSMPIIPMRRNGSNTPFFFFHGDYSGCGFYCRDLVNHVDSNRPFYVIPSHGMDGEPPRTIEEMAAERVEALLLQQKTGPFLLGGYCNGGLIAFETARQLENRGLKVDVVLVIDAPLTSSKHKVIPALFKGYGYFCGLNRNDRNLLGLRALIELQDCEFAGQWMPIGDAGGWMAKLGAIRKRLSRLKRIKRKLKKEGLVPPAVSCNESPASQTYREAYLRNVYHKAVRSYAPRHYDGKVVVLRSSNMDRRFPDDPSAGWSQVASEVEVRTIPGDHMTCITEHVSELAGIINDSLRATGDSLRDQS